MDIASRFPTGVQLDAVVSKNRPRTEYPPQAAAVLSVQDAEQAMREIQNWPGYEAAELRQLNLLSKHSDCGEVLYKDESQRFGLGSFKALGGAYAVLCLVASEYQRLHREAIPLAAIRNGDYRQFTASMTVTTATDGNHGRSVAWGAQNAGCRCRIYIHREVSDGRKRAMEAFGAEVIRVDGDYDDSVRICARESAEQGWLVVSDTSYEGYMSVPRNVMAGYTVIASEVLEQIRQPLTHIFIQAGVGGLAAAVCARLWMSQGADRPRMIIVESKHAACWLESFNTDKPSQVPVETETVMAGLSCGEVSLLAWEVLSACGDDVVTLADDQVATAMRLFADAQMSDQPIEAGECAVPGALALMGICADAELKDSFGINADSRILLIGCEGATDAEVYQQLLASVP